MRQQTVFSTQRAGKGKLHFLAARGMIFMVGLFVLSLGAATTIQANLGVPSWDVLHIALAQLTGLSIGLWVQFVGMAMIVLSCLLERRWPQGGTFVNVVAIGLFLDWILASGLLPVFHTVWLQALELGAGIILMGAGSGMYVAARLGAGPRDGLTLILALRWGWSIRRVRTFMEGLALTIGGFAGGPAAFGTVLSAVLIGPVMQASLRFWSRRLDAVAASAGGEARKHA